MKLLTIERAIYRKFDRGLTPLVDKATASGNKRKDLNAIGEYVKNWKIKREAIVGKEGLISISAMKKLSYNDLNRDQKIKLKMLLEIAKELN